MGGTYIRVSNYKTLYDQVRRRSRVCVVTFNYDTLMEEALQSYNVPLATISDYTKCSFFKLHGSIDWNRWIPKAETHLTNNEQPSEQALILNPPVGGEHFIIDRENHAPEETRVQRHFFLPALAIPTVSKQTFMCPPKHIEALTSIIPTITKIAIVGWRAGEKHFLKLLNEGLGNKPVKLLAACGSEEATLETLKRMGEAGIAANYESASANCGFSDFVVNRRIEPFLA